MGSELRERQMVGVSANGITLIDAVELPDADGKRGVTLYFDVGVDPTQVELPNNAETVATLNFGGAPVLRLAVPGTGPLHLGFAGAPVEITPAEPETDWLEGTNAAAAVRNGESAAAVLEWLEYNCARQGMNAAVILDRAAPESDKEFSIALAEGLKEAAFGCRVVVLRSSMPLGKPGLPAEAHPYCAPAAPGKDRMKVPDEDRWTAPLGVMHCYDIMRARFLAQARAVANIDVHDLLTGETPIFEQAVNAGSGLVPLFGQACYPWRVRKGEPIRFADHICVQFDAGGARQRWCIAPAKAGEGAVWRLTRVGNVTPEVSEAVGFYRFMALRHPVRSVSKIVPKTSLIEHEELLAQSKEIFGHKPVRVPDVGQKKVARGRGRCAIVTTMKNEGPFILEWLAYHRAIGFNDFLIYTNDCSDGTDDMLDLLQSKGFVHHRENPFRGTGSKPQHAALAAASDEAVIAKTKWIACIDVDEYINIKAGDGTLDALFKVVPDANLISMTWRLFGNADVHDFSDAPIIGQFTRCAPEYARKPHQAWGFKTLFQNTGVFKKLGVHRPKGLNPQLVDEINWVNGSGQPLPPQMYRNAWRSTVTTYGYDLVQLNHYAVRSAESFLVKRDRGRVNHVDRDQGLAYWFRMNNNAEQDLSIQRMLPKLRKEMDRLLNDPEIAAAHQHAVAMHRQKIEELRATENYAKFFDELTSTRMEKLAHLHTHFGSNVFLAGPECIPQEIVERDPDDDFFFTVERGEAAH